MLNILYLSHTAEIGGAEVSLLLLLKNLNKQCFHPIVVLPRSGPLQDRLASSGIETVTMPLEKIDTRNPLPYLCTVYRLTKLMRQLSIGLVHCNMDICNQYAIIAAKLNGLPLICHTRNILRKRAFRRMFLGWADVLIANSRAVADSYAQYIRKDHRVEIIPNGVDTVQFRPDRGCDSRSRFNIGDDEFVIGQIAQITRNKGQDVFIRALAHVVQIYPNVRALIVGDTVIDNSWWFLKELEKLLRELGLSNKVVFTGFVEDIVDLYRALDLVVVASQVEAFGRTAIEAMAMAKPVVATDSGGLSEIVVEGRTGLLVPYGNPEALADAILRLMGDPRLATEFGIHGRRRVEELFPAEKNVKDTERVYISLLSGLQDERENCRADAGEQR